MAIKCDDYHKVCVVSVDGDFTGEASHLLRLAADERIGKRSIVDFVIDLEKTDFIDSHGLESLLWLKRRSEELLGQMKLAAVGEIYRKILEMTRLESRFDCQASVPAALKAMR